MKFREFQLKDLEDIIKIEKDSFPKPFSEIIVLFLSEACKFFVAVEKKVVGFLIIGYEDMNTQHIYRIAVEGKKRGKDIGGQLIEKYVNKKCRTIARKSNKAAIDFYKKHGFKVIKSLKGNKLLLEQNQ